MTATTTARATANAEVAGLKSTATRARAKGNGRQGIAGPSPLKRFGMMAKAQTTAKTKGETTATAVLPTD